MFLERSIPNIGYPMTLLGFSPYFSNLLPWMHTWFLLLFRFSCFNILGFLILLFYSIFADFRIFTFSFQPSCTLLSECRIVGFELTFSNHSTLFLDIYHIFFKNLSSSYWRKGMVSVSLTYAETIVFFNFLAFFEFCAQELFSKSSPRYFQNLFKNLI